MLALCLWILPSRKRPINTIEGGVLAMENSTLRYEKNRSFGFAAGTEYWGSLPKTYLLACQTSSQYRR